MGNHLKGRAGLRAAATFLALVTGGCGWTLGGCASPVRYVASPGDPPPADKAAAAYYFLAQQQDLFHREFIVYDDHASGGVHFIPSGWMGDLEKVGPEVAKGIVDDACTDRPKGGLTCIRFAYPADLACRGPRRWVGIFSQFPNDNWGDRPGYDLSRYCRA